MSNFMISKDGRYNSIDASNASFLNMRSISSMKIPNFTNDVDALSKGQGNIFYDTNEKIIKYTTDTSVESIYPIPDVLITVGNGARFSTIREALDYSTSLLPQRSAVLVYPGIFVEQNPLIISDGVSLLSIGDRIATIVVAGNPLQELITLGNGCLISGFTLTGTLSFALTYNGSIGSSLGSIFTNCIIVDCTNGVLSTSGPGDLACFDLLIRTRNLPMTDAMVCQGGAIIRNFTTAIASGGPVLFNGCRSTDSNSLIVFNDGGFEGVQNAIIVENDASIEIKNCFIKDGDIGYIVRGSGAPSLNALSTFVFETISLDLLVTSLAGTIYIDGGTLRYDKISNVNNLLITANFFSQTPNDLSFQVLGELHVGSYNFPAEAAIGGGDSYTVAMTVQNDNGMGSFINITTDASDPNTTVNLLQGTGIGNTVYIGSTFVFFGIKTLTSVPWGVNNSQNIVFEYWNGAWVPIRFMVTKASAPYDSRTTRIYETIEDEQVRFGMMPGWVQNTVNGITNYWTRIRVTSVISNVPVIRQIKLHPSRMEINQDGYREYFGNARSIDMLGWDLGLLEPANATPSTADVFVSDNLNVGLQLNTFVNGAIDRLGFNTFLPQNTDTSMPLKFIWSVLTTATGGNIQWRVRWGYTNEGFDVFISTATAPTTGPNEQSQTLILPAPAAINRQLNYTAYLDISNFNPQPATGSPDILWITLERTGNAIPDTNTGSTVVIQIQGSYIKWNDGGYISLF